MISFMQGYAEFSHWVCSVYFNDLFYFFKKLTILEPLMGGLLKTAYIILKVQGESALAQCSVFQAPWGGGPASAAPQGERHVPKAPGDRHLGCWNRDDGLTLWSRRDSPADLWTAFWVILALSWRTGYTCPSTDRYKMEEVWRLPFFVPSSPPSSNALGIFIFIFAILPTCGL